MYDSSSPWWIFTELERYISLSYNDFAPVAREVFQPMEDELIAQVETAKKEYDGNDEKLKALSQEAFTRSIEAAKQVTAKIRKAIPQTRINYLMLDYFRDSAEGCGMPHDIKF